jgi:6,7-dimethyl-8-ribityllumazine synthase
MTINSIIEGKLNAAGLTFAIVASRFNSFIVDQLIQGAEDFLLRHGLADDALHLIKVPGAFEIPQVVRILAERKQFSGIICLGTIIRGSTAHFDLLAQQTTKALGEIAVTSGIPLGFGIVIADNLEQAIERAGTKMGNRGSEAAAAALEMVRVLEQLRDN